MSVPTLGHAAVNSMFLPNRRGVLKRDTNLRAKVRGARCVNAEQPQTKGYIVHLANVAYRAYVPVIIDG